MPVKRGILLMYLHNKILEKADRKDNLVTSYALHYASNVFAAQSQQLSSAAFGFAGNS